MEPRGKKRILAADWLYRDIEARVVNQHVVFDVIDVRTWERLGTYKTFEEANAAASKTIIKE